LRNVRPRVGSVNEFDIGEIFTKVEQGMRKSVEAAVASAPDQVRVSMEKGLGGVLEAMVGLMSCLSDNIKQERLAKDKVSQIQEAELRAVKEKLAEVSNITKSLTRARKTAGIRESIKEMESKVSDSQLGIKLLNVNVGQVTEDRREIVRRTIEEVRSWVKTEDVKPFDNILRRTRIVILGKGTSRREYGANVEFSVPTLFSCRDRRDAEEMGAIMRSAGYYPSFHWPKEVMEFIAGCKEEVRKQGVDPSVNYFRVRPEVREGQVLIKVEVKAKEQGNRFYLKGIWMCPPLNRDLWSEITDLYRPWNSSRK
jgi:hypothetical protein